MHGSTPVQQALLHSLQLDMVRIFAQTRPLLGPSSEVKSAST